MTEQLSAFNQDNLARIRADIETALQSVAEKHGIRLVQTKTRYTRNTFSSTIEGKIMVDTLTMLKVGASVPVQLVNAMEKHGLKATAGSRTLVDYKARNRKYPFIYTENGSRYKCSAEQAKLIFAM